MPRPVRWQAGSAECRIGPGHRHVFSLVGAVCIAPPTPDLLFRRNLLRRRDDKFHSTTVHSLPRLPPDFPPVPPPRAVFRIGNVNLP